MSNFSSISWRDDENDLLCTRPTRLVGFLYSSLKQQSVGAQKAN